MAHELDAIVGFEMVPERIEGKFKLSQNKSDADREASIAGLAREGDFRSVELAQFTTKYLRNARLALVERMRDDQPPLTEAEPAAVREE